MRALHVRKTKDRQGDIYKLEPPYNDGKREWEYCRVKCLPVKHDGICIWPAESSLYLADSRDGKYFINPAGRTVNIDNWVVPHKTVLAYLGYTLVK